MLTWFSLRIFSKVNVANVGASLLPFGWGGGEPPSDGLLDMIDCWVDMPR